MVPELPRLLDAHPDLSVEFSSGSALEDVAGLEADLAVRFVRPTSGDVIATPLRKVELVVLGAADRYGDRPPDWSRVDWISWKRSLSALPEARWLSDQFGVEPRIGFNRNTSVLAAVRAGVGVALLPRRALHRFKELIELAVPEGVTLPTYEMWLVKPVIHRANPAVNAVASWLVSLLADGQDGGR
jgi:DNA-binding transcriptional LysR family regulator